MSTAGAIALGFGIGIIVGGSAGLSRLVRGSRTWG